MLAAAPFSAARLMHQFFVSHGAPPYSSSSSLCIELYRGSASCSPAARGSASRSRTSSSRAEAALSSGARCSRSRTSRSRAEATPWGSASRSRTSRSRAEAAPSGGALRHGRGVHRTAAQLAYVPELSFTAHQKHLCFLNWTAIISALSPFRIHARRRRRWRQEMTSHIRPGGGDAEQEPGAAESAAARADAGPAAAAGAGAEAAAETTPPPEARRRWGLGLLKLGAFAAFTGAIGGVGYVTHAYSLSEVDQKTLEFRKKMTTPPHIEEDATELERFQALAISEAKKVPVAAIEFYLDLRNTIENHVTGFTEPTSDKLLPDLHPELKGAFTLVLDLNDTLVYSDWQRDRGWRTFKRPGVEAFVQHMAQYYEVVVYSDQQAMFVDPVVDRLDTKGYISYRLSRPATKYQDGKHYRDLSKLNRNPEHVLYISAHALESCLQPENCVSVKPWKLETDDTQLLDLIPFLEYLATARPLDVRTVLAAYQGHDIAAEFAKRAKIVERQKQEQQRKTLWRR